MFTCANEDTTTLTKHMNIYKSCVREPYPSALFLWSRMELLRCEYVLYYNLQSRSGTVT